MGGGPRRAGGLTAVNLLGFPISLGLVWGNLFEDVRCPRSANTRDRFEVWFECVVLFEAWMGLLLEDGSRL